MCSAYAIHGDLDALYGIHGIQPAWYTWHVHLRDTYGMHMHVCMWATHLGLHLAPERVLHVADAVRGHDHDDGLARRLTGDISGGETSAGEVSGVRTRPVLLQGESYASYSAMFPTPRVCTTDRTSL